LITNEESLERADLKYADLKNEYPLDAWPLSEQSMGWWGNKKITPPLYKDIDTTKMPY
jgi:hypothetical protein